MKSVKKTAVKKSKVKTATQVATSSSKKSQKPGRLDQSLLELGALGVEKLMKKWTPTKDRLAKESDLAWNMATSVLKKVKAVKSSFGPKTRTQTKTKKSTVTKKASKKSFKKVVRKKTTQKKK